LGVGLDRWDIWRGGEDAEVSCAELSAFGVEDVERKGFEVAGVEKRSVEERVSDDCGAQPYRQ